MIYGYKTVSDKEWMGGGGRIEKRRIRNKKKNPHPLFTKIK